MEDETTYQPTNLLESVENLEEVEQKIKVCSQFYENIYLHQLSEMLNLDLELIEVILSEMISMKKLKGSIDQAEEMFIFDEQNEEDEIDEIDEKEEQEEEIVKLNKPSEDPALKASNEYNENILELCNEIEEIVDAINQQEFEDLN